MFEAPVVARHVSVHERDPHARVDGKPAALPGEHVGGGRGVEPAAAAEPADYPPADTLGDGREIVCREIVSAVSAAAVAPAVTMITSAASRIAEFVTIFHSRVFS